MVTGSSIARYGKPHVLFRCFGKVDFDLVNNRAKRRSVGDSTRTLGIAVAPSAPDPTPDPPALIFA
jgi:hypothetical protein